MPTNANTFNSRVTSEALEAKFRQVFPAQGGAELVQDLFASGVIQPVVDFSTVAEGSVLPANLQTAWDFSTGWDEVVNTTVTLVNNPGFWLVDLTMTANVDTATTRLGRINLTDGLTNKTVWRAETTGAGSQSTALMAYEQKFVVFLRSGDSLTGTTNANAIMNVWYRQVADVNGTLVNPLGFTFS